MIVVKSWYSDSTQDKRREFPNSETREEFCTKVTGYYKGIECVKNSGNRRIPIGLLKTIEPNSRKDSLSVKTKDNTYICSKIRQLTKGGRDKIECQLSDSRLLILPDEIESITIIEDST